MCRCLFFCWTSLCLLPHLSLAQGDPEPTVAIRGVIQTFFDAVRDGDTLRAKQVFRPNATLRTVYSGRDGKTVTQEEPIASFLTALGQPHEAVWDERLLSVEIRVDEPLATVWTPYRFYLGDRFSHCGVNAFQLVKTDRAGVWQIVSITDTRRLEPCPETPAPANYPVADSASIAKRLDAWHLAAAKARFSDFFEAIAEDGIYLGTDIGERWTKAQFAGFAKPYFDKGKAWAFTPHHRRVYFSADGKTAWFEESLDTWMGECRGSGVLRRREGAARTWEIVHYNLAVAVPNDAIQAYLKVLKKMGKAPKIK